MQPRSQTSLSYSPHSASGPGAQQLSLTSLTTLVRPCSLRVSSVQAIQPTRPQRPEPSISVSRARLLCSGHAAWESDQLRLFNPLGLSARSPAAQFDDLNYSGHAIQPKNQFISGYPAHSASAPGAQQLSLTSSTTLLRPCCLEVRSAQAIQPTRPQRPEPSSSV